MVQDSQANGISQAIITATNVETGWEVRTQSDGAGRYVIPALPPGTYVLLADAKGYRGTRHTGGLLGEAGSVEEVFTLEAGDPAAIVEKQSPREALRSLESIQSDTISRDDLETLPQLERNPLGLSVFQPGVQIKAGDPESSVVNGTRQGSNNISLDGIGVSDSIDPRMGLSMTANNSDSVEQLVVITNGGDAQYGRNAGAQEMLITRSGGNRWSGDGFGYFRNKELNANDYFSDQNQTETPKFSQYVYGGSLGGPLIKGRTFVFGNYQGRRTFRQTTRNRMVLTSEAKSGLFQWRPPGSESCCCPSTYDIVKHDPRKLGIDDTVAKQLANLPDPNNDNIGDGLNTAGYQFNSPADSSADQFTLRADHNLTPNQRLFFRFTWARGSSVDWLSGADERYPGQQAGTIDVRNWGFSSGSDWSISSTMANQIRVGYQSTGISQNRPSRVQGSTFLANSWTDPLDPSFSRWRNSPSAEATDHLSMIRGKHALKTGVSYRYTLPRNRNEAGIYPDVTLGLDYGNQPPSSIGPSGNEISVLDRETFEKLYNDLLGRMEQVSQTFYSDLDTYQASGTARTRDFRYHDFGAFLQDDWKLRPNLTVNLGIRYELNGVPTEHSGVLGALDKANAISISSNIADFTLLRGSPWYQRDNTNFAPRIGFAWSPGFSSRTVLRGGFGIFYDHLVGTTSNFVDGNTPGSYLDTYLYPNLKGTDLRLSDGIPLPSVPDTVDLTLSNSRSTSVAVFAPQLRTPYVRQFNLLLQRELFRNTIVEAGYIGQRGVRLFSSQNLNQVKIKGDFLDAFKELQRFRASGTPVSGGNTLVRIFGSVNDAIEAIGGTNLDLGAAGLAADIVDREYYDQYASAGVSDFYIRNYPQYNQLNLGTNDGSSSYDSLQVAFRRDTGPFRARVNYTWSKSLDNISSDGNVYTIPLDSFDLNLNKAPSDADRTHIINSWVRYNLPFGSGRRFGPDASGWVGGLISNWAVGFLTTWETGPRISLSSGLQTFAAGVYSLANYTGGRNIGEVIHQGDEIYYFTADQIKAFSLANAGETGSSGRNSFVGPGYFDIDMSVVRDFRVAEQRRLKLRIEVYNLLNHTNYGLPNTDLSDYTNFGKISTIVGYPRQIQAALRYEF